MKGELFGVIPYDFERRYPPAFYALVGLVAWRVVRKLRSAPAS